MKNRKLSFLNHDKALLTAMIQEEDAESCISQIRNSASDGADAYRIQLCMLKREYKTENIFSYGYE